MKDAPWGSSDDFSLLLDSGRLVSDVPRQADRHASDGRWYLGALRKDRQRVKPREESPQRWEQPEGNEFKTPIEKAQIFILNNFRDEISLDRLALEARLSKFHFARQFKAVTGFTCMQYLSMVRLSEATKLIASTRLRISEVCYEVGFGDLTHFERQFKRDTGYTPSAFRKTFGRSAIRAER